MSQKIKSF